MTGAPKERDERTSTTVWKSDLKWLKRLKLDFDKTNMWETFRALRNSYEELREENKQLKNENQELREKIEHSSSEEEK